MSSGPIGGALANRDPFGDVGGKVVAALKAEAARLRRLGLPIVVDEGNGIEVVP
jgi:hypothetical protein